MTKKKEVVRGHIPTEATRARVQQGKGFKESEENIAKALGITRPTLRKHYRKELEKGEFLTLEIIRSAAMQQVMEGNTAMIIFLLKTLGGLTEKPEESKAQAAELPRVRVEIINKSDKDIKT